MIEAKNENHRCCVSPGASRKDGYADWEALMVPEGDALAQLACRKPASFPIIEARTGRALFWLCPEHKEEFRYVVDPVVGDELTPEDFEDRPCRHSDSESLDFPRSNLEPPPRL